MIKFTTTSGDKNRILVGLGLEARNIERMQQGQPIVVRLSELGFHGALGSVEILIFTGPDVATMERDLRAGGLIDGQTVVRDERHAAPAWPQAPAWKEPADWDAQRAHRTARDPTKKDES